MSKDSAVVLDLIRAVRLASEFSAGMTKDAFVGRQRSSAETAAARFLGLARE